MIASVFVSIGIMCLLTGLLAGMMAIADATIGDYGTTRISVNDGDAVIEARGGNSLLATLKEHEIFIPSACGGRGSCGLCKVRVESGGGEILPTETPWLTPEEQKNRMRLSCQLKVRGDLSIVLPKELLSVRQFRTRVSGLRSLTHDIKEVRLELLEPKSMEFRAGAFIQFEVPPYALTAEPVYRAYSIASPPSRPGVLDLEIRYVPDGICTTYVHKYLKEGDIVIINGPHGEFCRSETDRDMLCIAGGSGMAPIKSILEDMRDAEIRRKAVYFFGARARRDLFLLDEMKQLEKDLPDFRFIPVLSEPDPEDDWPGETGLVTEAVARAFEDVSEMEAYLCGSPLMIDACIKVLRDKGLPQDRIFYDKFA